MNQYNQNPIDSFIKSLDEKVVPSVNEEAWTQFEKMLDHPTQIAPKLAEPTPKSYRFLRAVWVKKLPVLAILMSGAIWWAISTKQGEAMEMEKSSLVPVQEETESSEDTPNSRQMLKVLGKSEDMIPGSKRDADNTLQEPEISVSHNARETQQKIDSSSLILESKTIDIENHLERTAKNKRTAVQDSTSIQPGLDSENQTPIEQQPRKKKHLFW